MSTCFCVGPQNGEPLCPCRMQNVQIIKGRYVRVEDLGPAPVYTNNNDDEKWNWKEYVVRDIL